MVSVCGLGPQENGSTPFFIMYHQLMVTHDDDVFSIIILGLIKTIWVLMKLLLCGSILGFASLDLSRTASNGLKQASDTLLMHLLYG